MSCGCSELGFPAGAETPCTDCPPNSAANESLPSALANFIYQFYGTLTKTDNADGTVSWVLPCDLDTGIEGNPRAPGEGLACYFKRLLEEGVIGVSGKDGFAKTTAEFIQPAVDATVVVSVDRVECFAVDQYVWSATGGFYLVTAVGDSTVTLKNLKLAPDNLGEGGTVPSGTYVFQSGPAALPGPQGDTGAAGEDGHASYVYVGYASDVAGADFSLDPATATNKYIAVLVSDVEIVAPIVTDFAGLWTRYQGTDGAAGQSGAAVPNSWSFLAPGTHKWVCPAGIEQIRVRVYAAGGGGGGGASTVNGAGDGFAGGGGEFLQGVFAVTAGTVYSFTIGAGGVGGTGGDATADGVDGGDSSAFNGVSTYLVARGGKGGTAAINGTPSVGAGGAGGGGITVPEFQLVGTAGGIDGDQTLGGHCGSMGSGGLASQPGETPGGGGGAGVGDAGGPGDDGSNGADGMVYVEDATP